jgi:hypothetical protein
MPTVVVKFEVEVVLEPGTATMADDIIRQAFRRLDHHMLDEEIVTFGHEGQLRRSAAVQVNQTSCAVDNDGHVEPLETLVVTCDRTSM